MEVGAYGFQSHPWLQKKLEDRKEGKEREKGKGEEGRRERKRKGKEKQSDMTK